MVTKQYVDAVRKSEIAMRPVLPLGLPIDLGHVGTISDDGTFNQRGTISSMLGLNSIGDELPAQASSIRINLTSGKDVSVDFGANVKTDGVLAQFANVAGRAAIHFGSSNSFFASIDGLKIRQLEEPQLLINAILSAYEVRHWDKEFVFVHRIGVANRLTVILASDSDTTVLLKASAVVAANAAVDINLAAGFKFVASTKAVTQITGARGVSAFYDAYKVKDGWLTKPRVERYRLAVPFGLELNAYPESVHRVATATESFRLV